MKNLMLYAEDDRDIAELFSIDFKESGYDVNWAKDGPQALELYQKEAPDIIVLDIVLPEMNGYEVANEIRKRDLLTPILLMSAIPDDEAELKCVQSNANCIMRNKKLDKGLYAIMENLIKKYPVNRGSKFSITADTWLDMDNNILHSAGCSEKISFRDKNLLLILLRNKSIPMKREVLESEVWGDKDRTREESLYKSLSLLRKIMANDKNIELQTKRNSDIVLIVR